MEHSGSGRPEEETEKIYVFDRPQNVQRLLRGFYICCGVLLLLDFVLHRHFYHPWEKIPGFYALYGFVACVLLVLAARWMRGVVMRSEDYYDRPVDD